MTPCPQLQPLQGKKNSVLPGLSPPLTLIYDPKMAFTVKTRVCLCLFVCELSEKSKGCKKKQPSRVEVLWVFMDPPTLGISLIALGWGGGGDKRREMVLQL